MFSILADGKRREILDVLREQDRAVGDIAALVGLSQPGVSKHLRVLRDAGLVDVRPVGQRRLYRLRAEPLREVDAWLQPYRQAWAKRLDALDDHLAQSKRRPRREDGKTGRREDGKTGRREDDDKTMRRRHG